MVVVVVVVPFRFLCRRRQEILTQYEVPPDWSEKLRVERGGVLTPALSSCPLQYRAFCVEFSSGLRRASTVVVNHDNGLKSSFRKELGTPVLSYLQYHFLLRPPYKILL